MKLTKLRRYRKKHDFFRSMSLDNPALLIGVDLPFVIGTAFTLKNAAALSIQMLIIHFGTMMIARTLVIHLPGRYRALVNIAISTVMMLISREIVMLLFPGIVNSVGMYLYLMAVNGITLIQANSKRGPRRPREVAVRALADIMLFTLMMFAVSLVREVFGNATIWGVPIPLKVKLSGMLIPFFGFIFTGFILALMRVSTRKLAAVRMSGAALRDASYTEIQSPVQSTSASDETLDPFNLITSYRGEEAEEKPSAPKPKKQKKNRSFLDEDL